MILWAPLVIALALSLLSIPFVRIACYRRGWLAIPSPERWHRKATPTMGGLAIVFSVFASLSLTWLFLFFSTSSNEMPAGIWTDLWSLLRPWSFLLGSLFIFILGVVDDLKHISPPAKLIGQILAAAIVISLGFNTNFFTPLLANDLLANFLNTLVTFIWLVGITNAINLLDNMDGLAGGISLIAAVLLGYLFWEAGNLYLVIVALAISGALIGYLVYNYPPARIFMGDSGSMFLGFTLAALAIVRQPQASNVFAILAVPTMLFLLPILDTSLVTITRLMRGASPVQGGRDHTSHRLVAFGLNERQVLWALYGVAALSGVLAIMIESSSYSLSLILVPILVITFALVTAYLGGIKIATSKTVDLDEELTNAHPENPASTIASPFVRVIVNLTFKRHLFEVLLDFVIMILAFYLAFVALYGITLSEQHWLLFINALPSVVAMTYISFFAMGVYRGVWRYVSSNDFIRYTKAAALSMILAGLSIYLIYTVRAAPTNPPANVAYSPVLFLFFGILLFLGLAATRSSFKLMDVFFNQQLRIADEKVLIFGATDSGEMAARWILMNPQFKFKPVGFIDEDSLKIGRNIHGIEVLGNTEQLRTILIRQKIDGMIFTAPIQPQSNAARAQDIALGLGCWIRQFRLEFEVIE